MSILQMEAVSMVNAGKLFRSGETVCPKINFFSRCWVIIQGFCCMWSYSMVAFTNWHLFRSVS
jgi:hypothetical protein